MSTTKVTTRVDTRGHAAKCVALQLLYSMMPEGTDIHKLSNACEVIANETRLLADVLPMLEEDTCADTLKNLIEFFSEQLASCVSSRDITAADHKEGNATGDKHHAFLMMSLFDTHGYARQAIDSGFLPEECTSESYSDSLRMKMAASYFTKRMSDTFEKLGNEESVDYQTYLEKPIQHLLISLLFAIMFAMSCSVVDVDSKARQVKDGNIIKVKVTDEEKTRLDAFNARYSIDNDNVDPVFEELF